MSKSNHILTKDEFHKVYTAKQGFFSDLFARKPGKDEVDQQRKVEGAYTDLLQTGADLFENSTQEISQEEIDLLKHRKKKANRIWLILVLCFAVPFGILAILSGNPFAEGNLEETIGLPFLVIGIFGYRYLMNRNYNAILSCKEKQVLKGVVTNKHTVVLRKNDDEAGCFLELSLQMAVQVGYTEFKSTQIGDVVQIDVFSDDIAIKPIVTKRGVFP
jgi:hypothetical protein